MNRYRKRHIAAILRFKLNPEILRSSTVKKGLLRENVDKITSSTLFEGVIWSTFSHVFHVIERFKPIHEE